MTGQAEEMHLKKKQILIKNKKKKKKNLYEINFFLRLLYLILNSFFLKNVINKINFNNLFTYRILLNNKYKINTIILLNYPQTYKYNWSVNSSLFMKFININILNIFNLETYNFYKLTNNDKVNDIIFYKKKSAVLKKSADYEFVILNYINSTKEDILVEPNFLLNNEIDDLNNSESDQEDTFKSSKVDLNFDNQYKYFDVNDDDDYSFNSKTVDFKRQINLVFRQNRLLLRKILKVKFKREFVFSKYIKNLTKLGNFDLYRNFENRLLNILARSSFFFNHKDCLWFIKNGYVTINGLVSYNEKKLIKPMEVINLPFNNYYFFYYRYILENCINNLYRFNTKIWKINYQRNNPKKGKNEEKYSNWIYKYMFYRDDIPKFLEVDFISMSIVLLNYTLDKNHVDYYNIKFLNLYMNRLYNWKRII